MRTDHNTPNKCFVQSHSRLAGLRCCIGLAVVLLLTVMAGCGRSGGVFRQAQQDTLSVSELARQLGFSKDRPLVMGMNTSYAPLQYVDEQGVPQGYDVEFTKLLMHRMGIPYTLSPNHWDKMSPGIIEGKYDMGMLVYSSYRKNITNYSDAVFRLYYQMLYRKADYQEFDFRHLKGKKIAYMKSRPVGQMLTKEGAIGTPVTDLAEAITDLSKGKYDGVICYRFQAKYFTHQQRLEQQLKADDLSMEPREYCYASHDSLLIVAINDELRRMEQEGVIDEVYGQEVAEHFGSIAIPMWVWWMLVAMVVVFLLIFSVNNYRYSKHLQAAHRRLQKAYDEMAEKNEALQIATAKAEESTKMKSSFIQQISHEIRTPLNILSGFTQVITDPQVKLTDAEKVDISARITENTERITGLVNKMLELSDVSSTAVIERTEQVTARQIAKKAVEESGIGEAAHLDFELQVSERCDVPFKSNLRFASRALELLLDNAMKFTHPAESLSGKTDQQEKKQQARLTVRVHERQVVFTVEDTGVSIPLWEAEHIFEEFVQLDEYYDGTGIGLTVARSLARRMGGDVWLDTTCTTATRFEMMLPMEEIGNQSKN